MEEKKKPFEEKLKDWLLGSFGFLLLLIGIPLFFALLVIAYSWLF